MKRITSILLTLALMIGGSAMAQIQIPGGAIKPPVPPVKQRLKPKAKARPKKQVKYYDVTFNCNAPDADLYIDGNFVGDANIIWTLKAGSHAVKVVTDYYNDYSTTVKVSSSNKSFDLNLTEKTDAESQFQIGINYHEGRSGFPQDYDQALNYFAMAAEKGYVPAITWIGYCFKTGHGITQDFQEAVKWFTLAAEQGNSAAQNNLGHCYQFGLGVEKDYAKAIEW